MLIEIYTCKLSEKILARKADWVLKHGNADT